MPDVLTPFVVSSFWNLQYYHIMSTLQMHPIIHIFITSQKLLEYYVLRRRYYTYIDKRNILINCNTFFFIKNKLWLIFILSENLSSRKLMDVPHVPPSCHPDVLPNTAIWWQFQTKRGDPITKTGWWGPLTKTCVCPAKHVPWRSPVSVWKSTPVVNALTFLNEGIMYKLDHGNTAIWWLR